VAWAEVTEEELVLGFIVIAAFNEDGGEGAGCDFWGGIAPDEVVPWVQGNGVGFDVAKDEEFGAGVYIADEEGGAIVGVFVGGDGERDVVVDHVGRGLRGSVAVGDGGSAVGVRVGGG
jgi:hypothetical protein